MKEKLNKHFIMVLLILLISTILLLPMFLTTYKVNDDTWFHLMNIGLIKNGIKENFWNGFIMRILPFVGNNLGYGTRLFYPPLAHTLGAYLAYGLEFFNLNILWSLKIFHFITMFLSGLAMYFCSYRFHKDKYLALLSSVIYMGSCYHMSEIYVRDSLGESLLFVFLPFIIVSIKELLEGHTNYFYPCFILGYAGGILSHFTMMIYITLVLGFSMLFYYKKIFQKDFLIPFLKACLIVFLLTAFFFEPMIEHKLYGSYMVYKKWYMSLGIYHTTLWGIEYLFNLSSNPISFRFSFVTLILLTYVLIKKRKEILNPKYLLVTVFLGISFLMSTRLFFLWLILPYLFFMIQFGWRMVLLVIFGVALISPLALKECQKKYLKVGVIIIIGLASFTFPNNHREDLDLEKIGYGAIMGWQKEYLPEKIGDNEENKKYFEERNEEIIIVNGNGTSNILKNKVPYLEFEINTDDTLEIELPRIYYFGYNLKDQNGNNISLFENERGFLGAKVNAGNYTLEYTGTAAYKICTYVSLISFCGTILYILYYIYNLRFRNYKKNNVSFL